MFGMLGENRHVGSFGKVSQSRHTTWQFGELQFITSYFICNIELGSLNFTDKPNFIKCAL